MTDHLVRKATHPATSEDARISQPEVARLLGNVSPMTLWRWRNDPSLTFPKPILQVNGRSYYRVGDILNWRPPPRPSRSKKNTSPTTYENG
jgi:hypothetical protein